MSTDRSTHRRDTVALYVLCLGMLMIVLDSGLAQDQELLIAISEAVSGNDTTPDALTDGRRWAFAASAALTAVGVLVALVGFGRAAASDRQADANDTQPALALQRAA